VLKSAFRLNQHDPFFFDLQESARIKEIVSAIFDDPDIVSRGINFFAKAAGSGSRTVAHQDNGFHIMVPPEGLTATIALDASSSENGVLCCLRGSHKLGLLPHVQSGIPGFSRQLAEPLDSETYPEAALCMQPGDLAFHHIDSVHYSGANRSPHGRRQLGTLWFSSRAKQDEKAAAKYKQGLNELHASKLGNSGNGKSE
jgi:ectoine hydroxylase-related dioxygenase (phytanoyl-CoA dioxygenase family)